MRRGASGSHAQMGKKISVTRKHTLGLEGATGKLVELTGTFAEKYNLKTKLSGSAVEVSGSGVKGNVRVTAETVIIDLDLGLPASLVAGKIEDGIQRQLEKYFG
jgi:putative polyhydroxyalkanoate system protein